MTEGVSVVCANCGKRMSYPPPFFINEISDGHLRSFYCCQRKCFSIFIKVFMSKWKPSERGENGLDAYTGNLGSNNLSG